MNRSWQWDIFCKVIDNFGDIGVCWRLASDLASRGHRVRLWADDTSALQWMAPSGCPGVHVLAWSQPLEWDASEFSARPPDVMVEAFGCEVAPEFIAACTRPDWENGQKPLWINLEYLSAESYVERCHAMPSPVQSGPATGWVKWFFYPGFTPATGGLLREPDLLERLARFDRTAWLAGQGISWQGEAGGECLVSLFCYEPPALAGLLRQWAQHGLAGQAVHLLVASGRAAQAVKAVLNDEIDILPNQDGRRQLSISYLNPLTQRDFDHLLWACDLNFVRGEDSVVRALWAGKPFVWQIYPQDDDAHRHKLAAFLGMLGAQGSLRAFHQHWNAGISGPASPHAPAGGPMPGPPDLGGWQSTVNAARSRLLAQDDLGTLLLRFVAKNR